VDKGGNLTVTSCTGCGGSVTLSTITAATASNTINNAANPQVWQWNSQTTGTAFQLSSSSLSSGSLFDLTVTGTAATGNTQKAFNISTSGANATSTQTTYGSYTTNTHTGTASTNVAGYFSASGGTNNYAGIFESGRVGIGTTTPNGALHVTGANAEGWSYFAGNVNNSGNPANIQGLQLGWNRGLGEGDSDIVYNTSIGGAPRLAFASYNGTTYTEEMTLRGGKLGVSVGSNPLGALDVTASGAAANNWIYFWNNNTDGSNPSTSRTNGFQFGWNKSGGNGEAVLSYGTGAGSAPRLDFASWSGSTFTTEMTLRSGKLAVGNTNPTSLGQFQLTSDSTDTTNPIALNINSIGAAGELTASSSIQTFAQIAPVINQTSTAGYTALKINATETATGSGAKLLFDAQVGGVSKAKIDNTGALTVTSCTGCGGGGSTALSGLTAASATNTIDNLNFAQTWNWSTAATENPFTWNANALTTGKLFSIASSSTAITSAQLLNVTSSGAPASSWTGTVGLFEQTSADVDVDGNALKVGLTGAAAGDGTALNVTTAQTGTSALALRVNDDGTYTDSTPVVVDATGQVGIGITNPSNIFHVATSVNQNIGKFEYNATTANGGILELRKTRGTFASPTASATNDYGITEVFTNHDGTSYIQNAYIGYRITGTVGSNSIPGQLFFSTRASNDTDPFANSTVRMSITTAGNVGIGNTAPAQKLDVLGNAFLGATSHVAIGEYDSGGASFVNLATNTSATVLLASNLYINTAGALKIAKTHGTLSGGAITIPGNAQTRQNYIEFWTTPTASVTADASYAQASPRMLISPTGNVSIGAEPSVIRKLNVAGSMRLNNDSSTTLNNNYYSVFDDSNNVYGMTLGYANSRYRTQLIAPGNDNSRDIAFGFHTLNTFPTNQSDVTERMVIQGGGNVGIGIVAPTSRLHVQQFADSAVTATPVGFDLNSVGAAGELTASSGVQTFARIAPVINQTSTAGYTALLVNATETATGSGTRNLLDLQVGAASRLSLASSGALQNTAGAQTVASASGAEFTTATFTAPTITLTGSTQVTSQMDSFLFNQPTITDASAVTVDNAASMTIAGAPVKAGSVTLTNTYGLKINAGAVSTATNSFGLYVDAQTGATNNYAAVFATGNVGIGVTAPTAKLDITQGNTLTSGNLTKFSHSGNYNNSQTVSGNVLNVSRSLVATGISGNITLSGALASFADLCDPGGSGACTSTANVVKISQDYTSASGAALLVTHAGSGPAISVGSGDKFKVTNAGIASVNLNGTATTNGICHSGANVDAATDTTRDLVACSGAPADVAEFYETDSLVTAGDVVVSSNEQFTYDEPLFDPITGQDTGLKATRSVPILSKAYQSYSSVIGVVSTSPYQAFGRSVIDAGAKNPQPIALAGRVPVKVSLENGPISVGDFLTVSATKPGFAMKADRSGVVIGQALESVSAESEQSVSTLQVFINVGYQIINNTFVLDPKEIQLTNQSNGGDGQSGDLSFLVNQVGVSDIMHLQSSGVDRFIVTNDGSVSILANHSDPTKELLVVSNNNTSIFSVTASGHLSVSKDTAGTVVMKSGEQEVRVVFKVPYSTIPKIAISVEGVPNFTYGIKNKTTEGFTIATNQVVNTDVLFDWIALMSPEDGEVVAARAAILNQEISTISISSIPIVNNIITTADPISDSAPLSNVDSVIVESSEPAVDGESLESDTIPLPVDPTTLAPADQGQTTSDLQSNTSESNP
jgi:hypothetical protein